jgi:type II secretory pathway component GspD/PulD (secretin)
MMLYKDYKKVLFKAIFPIFLTVFVVIPLLQSGARASADKNRSYDSARIENLAKLLIKDHHFNEAVTYLKDELKLIEDRGEKFGLLILLADAYIASGDYDSARATLEQAKEISSSGAEHDAILKREKDILKGRNTAGAVIADIESSADSLDDTGPAVPEEQSEPQPLITNSFFETDLRQVLTDLSLESGIPIIWDNTVQGLVTYEAVDQPLEEVLEAILYPVGFTYRSYKGKYIVGSANPEDPAFGLVSGTEVIDLSNTDAVDAIAMLSDYFKPYVKASKIRNAICITAPISIIDRLKADIKLIDEPPVQILIDVVVTEISTRALRKIGLDWSLTKSTGNPTWNVKTDHTDIAGKTISADFTDTAFDLGDYTGELLGSLEAMVQSGEAKIRANPRLTTVNGNKAEIGITKDQYFIIQTSTSPTYSYNTLQSISSGIRLEITPLVSDDNEITIRVRPEVGDVVGSGAEGLPEISVRSANTIIRVKDGETSTIGGLNFQTEKTNRKKIPLLGSIPILGYLFRYDEHEKVDTQIVIFITPHILQE